MELPWPDVKMASMLCVGGPCRYVLVVVVSDEFILNHVAPNIRKRFDEEILVILGMALLHSIFCINDTSNNVPSTISRRVRTAYTGIVDDPSVPPVRRGPILCTGNAGEIYIDDFLSKDQLQANQGANQDDNQDATTNQGLPSGTLSDRPLRDQLRALQSQLQTVKGVLEVIEKRLESNHTNEIRQI